MREYHGLFEKGWDCTNSNCGKIEGTGHKKEDGQTYYDDGDGGVLTEEEWAKALTDAMEALFPSVKTATEEDLDKIAQGYDVKRDPYSAADTELLTIEEWLANTREVMAAGGNADDLAALYGIKRLEAESPDDFEFRIKAHLDNGGVE
jgi:hypothetical protein